MFIISILFSIVAALIEVLNRGRLSVIIPYAFIVPALMLLPRLILKTNGAIRDKVNGKWLKSVEALIFGLLVLNIPNSLILSRLYLQYDRFLHFGVAFLGSIILLLLLLPFQIKKEKIFEKMKIFIQIFFITFISMFLWEGFQYTTDKIFGSHLFWDLSQSMRRDVVEDILFGFLGITAALIYANVAFKKFLLVLK